MSSCSGHRTRGCLLAAAALALAAVGTGCGSSDADQPAAAGSSGGSKAVEIGMALTMTGIPSFTQLADGAKAAASSANARIDVVGPATATGSAEATMAENLQTSKQPDGLGVNPCILPAWTRTITSVLASVPRRNVVAFECPPIAGPGDKTPLRTFIGPSGFGQGYATAIATVRGAGLTRSTSGTALIAQCDPSIPNIVQGVEGIEAALKELLPDVRQIEFASSLKQSANTTAWSSAFSKDSGVTLAMGFCDQDAQSLVTLKGRGVGGKYVAGAAEPTGASLKAIKDGVLAGGAQQASWLQGNVTARLLADQARGKAIPAGWIDTGNYLITKDNVDAWIAADASPEAQGKLLGPVADKLIAGVEGSVRPMDDVFARGKPSTTVVG